MKKTVWLLVAVAGILILAAGGLLWYLISTISRAGPQVETRSVEDYLAEQWPEYSLEAWDAETGRLTLSRSLKQSYEVLERFGAEMNDVVEGHLATMKQIAAGMQLHCGQMPREIRILGLSSDGKEAYAASSDGSITACWLQAEAAAETGSSEPSP